ncbi:hypothetical protein KUCAC02_020522 [Chaenocephalus aceratus]|nr:hypothetical protein KUCAC02_020522 [Chaenocephalus aceratus]
MSERRENEEQEVNEYEEEEEDTDTNVEPGGNTVEQPAEDNREPGRRGEEQEDWTTPDVLEAAEEAASDLQDGLIRPGNAVEVGNLVATETQADLSHDAEQLGEPQRTEHVGNSTATVKVVLVPEGHVMTVAFAIGLSIAQLKLHLANELRVPADVLHIFLDGRAVDEQQSLMELGVRPNGSTRMEMSSIDPDSHPLRPLRPPEQDMPDVITRQSANRTCSGRWWWEIERPPQQKAFLGGFKHRLTGTQYHHAAVQTFPKRRADRGVVLFSRNTQTVELQSEAQQCPLDASTQMMGIGCYVSCVDDKLVAPGNYITADQYHEERLRAVVVLQTFARRWLALQEVQRLRRDRDRRLGPIGSFNTLYRLVAWCTFTCNTLYRLVAWCTFTCNTLYRLVAWCTFTFNTLYRLVAWCTFTCNTLYRLVAWCTFTCNTLCRLVAWCTFTFNTLYRLVAWCTFTCNTLYRLVAWCTFTCNTLYRLVAWCTFTFNTLYRLVAWCTFTFNTLYRLVAWCTFTFNTLYRLVVWCTFTFNTLYRLVAWCTFTCNTLCRLVAWCTFTFNTLYRLVAWCTFTFNTLCRLVAWCTFTFNTLYRLVAWCTFTFNTLCRLVAWCTFTFNTLYRLVAWCTFTFNTLYRLVAWCTFTFNTLYRLVAWCTFTFNTLYRLVAWCTFTFNTLYRLVAWCTFTFNTLYRLVAWCTFTCNTLYRLVAWCTFTFNTLYRLVAWCTFTCNTLCRLVAWCTFTFNTLYRLVAWCTFTCNTLYRLVAWCTFTCNTLYRLVAWCTFTFNTLYRLVAWCTFTFNTLYRLVAWCTFTCNTLYRLVAWCTFTFNTLYRLVAWCTFTCNTLCRLVAWCTFTFNTLYRLVAWCTFTCNTLYRLVAWCTFTCNTLYRLVAWCTFTCNTLCRLVAWCTFTCNTLCRLVAWCTFTCNTLYRLVAWCTFTFNTLYRLVAWCTFTCNTLYRLVAWCTFTCNTLYRLVAWCTFKWRSEEEQQINSSLRGAERKAALCFLLETETQLIAAIGHHRIAVQNNNYDKVVRNLLDKSAAPRQWRAADGRLMEMDSEHTVRAAELRELYNNLSSESQEQRLEHLLTLRHTEHECQLTRDIVDLIDREADLMTRQVKVASLQVHQTPAFNPEVAKHLKVPQDPSQLKNDMFQCRGCQRYLQSSDFSPTAGARLSGRCRDCTGLDNIARSRDDFSCYRNILRRLRSDEMRLNRDAKIPFLLQVPITTTRPHPGSDRALSPGRPGALTRVEDVRYLVEVLWASRSALHSSSDLYSLVFVRWEKRRVWSPWNCILLSKEETSAHLEVDDVHKAYEVTFLRRVDHKHMLARRHFSSIPVMAEHLEPTATLGNQLVSKPVTMATGKPAVHTPAGSAH